MNHAIEELVAVIAGAPADAKTREGWLERLWEAHANDEIPYIERLGDFWGELCASPEIASAWADRLVPIVEMAFSPDCQLLAETRDSAERQRLKEELARMTFGD